MAATAGSPSSAISRAAPAVSKLSTDSRPRPRIRSRHWRRGVGVAPDPPEPPRIGAGKAEQTVPDPVEVLPDDVQTRVPQQVVDEGDPASERVVHGDHRARRALRFDDLERLLESGAREGGRAPAAPRGRRRASTPRAPPDRRCGGRLPAPVIASNPASVPPGRCVSKFASPPRPLAGAFPPRILSAHRFGLGAAVGRTGRETLKA